jgi:hypothetical protein
MKVLRSIMSHSLGVMLTTGVVSLGSLPFAQVAQADTWVDCAAQNGTCNIPDNAPTSATVRYGNDAVYAYLYSVEADSIVCSNGLFGDPVPGVSKRCSYAFDVEPRSAPAQALHTILDTDDDPNDLDHSDFLAETLSEGEKIVSSNGEYELTLEDDGALVLRKVSGSGQGEKYRKEGDSTATAKDLYRLHMTEYGFEVRKNNNSEPVYKRTPYPLAADTNFALHVTDQGYVRLVDMESYTNRWSAFPSNSERITTSEVIEDDIEDIWAKMGWTYTNGWTSTEHRALDDFDSHSHYHAHEVAQLMEDTPSLPDGRELFDRQSRPQTIELKQSYIEGEPDLSSTREATKIARFLKEVMGIISTGNLDLVTLFADDIEMVMQGRGFSEVEVERLLNATSEGTPGENRLLGVAPVIECSGSKYSGVGRRICNMLSKDKNSNKSIDYAVEMAPTWATSALKNNKWINAGVRSKGVLNQLQFRFFFKHPRLRGDRRNFTEIRIRIMDFSGGFVDKAINGDKVSGAGALVTGLVSIHDFIMTLSWGENENFRDNAKYEGMKYGVTTGLTFDLEGTFASKNKNLATNYNLQDTKVVDIPGFDLALPMEQVEITGLEALKGEGTQLIPSIAEKIQAILEGVVEKLDFNVSSTLELGVGLGIYNIYDLRKMAEETDGSPAGEFFKIALSEALGAGTAVLVGQTTGFNAWAIATGANAASLINEEVMVGGLAGDAAFTAYYKFKHGNTDAIAQGFSVFWWAAAIAGFSLDENAGGLPARLEEAFGPEYTKSASYPVRFRLQYNQDIIDKPFYTRSTSTSIVPLRLTEYGIFELRTKHNKCIADDPSSDALVQQSCSEPSRQHLWLVNAIGGDTSKYVELRAFDSGKCITLSDGSYTANTITNGTDLSVVRCDSLVNPMAARWKANYTGDDSLQLQSALDPTMCMDLEGGQAADGTAMQVWTCVNEHPNMEFSMVAADTFSDSIDESSTLRMADNRCLDVVNQADMPAKGIPFTVLGCDGGPAQNLVVEEADSGWYKIKVRDQNRYLDVSGVSTRNNAVVHTWTGHNGHNQHWQPLKRTDGTFALKSRHSDKCLQLNEKTNDTTVLVQYTCDTKRKSQRFSLVNSRFEQYGDLDSRGVSHYLPFQSATQDSTLKNHTGADRAIDGNLDGYYYNNNNNSVTHSSTNNNSYWQGDLGRSEEISDVFLFNRQDCCSERLNNFYVLISDIPFSPGANLASARGNAKAEVNVTTPVDRYEPRKVSFPAGTKGQYVQVFLPNGYLSLAEVEARGPAVVPTSKLMFSDEVQNSTLREYSNANRATDGIFDGNWHSNSTNSVTHSKTNNNSFWQGDLGSSRDVSDVFLFNRKDCCKERLNNFTILISDEPLIYGETLETAKAKTTTTSWLTVTTAVDSQQHYEFPAGTSGQFVQIFMPKGYLSLTEVEVHGPD